ncbi:MAG: type II toxin-antitoxin system RelE/ParE family toxin [Acidobacteria bacterium]|nr:type II toxin-antitoxin system RelE/ParE family toxin [Acidobacteriota bacterium]MCI0722155.1 type II toxin-antitoxin system RelE/ParE family toxin [Acidobacteriota bacterium]
MIVHFLAPAQAEFAEAIAYYNTQREGLGFEFAAEVRKAIDRIIQYPEAWSHLSKRTRRCRTSRFPYGIIYQIKGESLLIVAVMHLHREPQTWRERLPKEEQ